MTSASRKPEKRLLALQREHLLPKLPDVINMLTTRLKQLAATPARPDFNHNLFECLALSIRILCKVHFSVFLLRLKKPILGTSFCFREFRVDPVANFHRNSGKGYWRAGPLRFPDHGLTTSSSKRMPINLHWHVSTTFATCAVGGFWQCTGWLL